MHCAVARGSLDIGFGGGGERDLAQLYPHAQVLADGRHQRRAHHVHQPPGQRGGEARVVHPAAQQVEEVDGDGEIQALLPSPDEVQQGQGAAEGREQVNELCQTQGKGGAARAAVVSADCVVVLKNTSNV